MKRHRRSAAFLVATFLLLVFGHSVDGATFSLRAVRLDGHAVTPTNNITANPGDEIEADIFLFGWGGDLPLGVIAYQVVIAGEQGFSSGSEGAIPPKGWCEPIIPIVPCSTESPCPDVAPICRGGVCYCDDYGPELGAWIDESRADWLFFPGHLKFCDPFPCCFVDTSTLDYRFTCMGDPVEDTGIPRYLGRLVLVVGESACGTFTIGFDIRDTSLVDGSSEPIDTVPNLRPLNITIGNCVPPPDGQWCIPEHCAIDARIAHSPTNFQERYTWNEVIEHVAEGTEGMTRDDFAVSHVPNVGAVPQVASLTTEVYKADITLNRKINPGVWTCVRQVEHNRQCCMASLPGDVDGSRVSQPADIFELLDNLCSENPPALSLERCDIDRSRLCTGADILSEVDILVGADALEDDPELSLPECPPRILQP